ncbi:hypothetical protein [Rhizobium sp. L1K21]|uniref:hypothetical protein n=1 Tax=Rhizobium sp. L1K21 TaxID=2954933 RepID=UPI002092AA5B|nr:hypothetical protein [Rhizobium sp. L1K21]MCO6187085.1 hypothetical protein [Rhizobium sp. L1K21]
MSAKADREAEDRFYQENGSRLASFYSRILNGSPVKMFSQMPTDETFTDKKQVQPGKGCT